MRLMRLMGLMAVLLVVEAAGVAQVFGDSPPVVLHASAPPTALAAREVRRFAYLSDCHGRVGREPVVHSRAAPLLEVAGDVVFITHKDDEDGLGILRGSGHAEIAAALEQLRPSAFLLHTTVQTNGRILVVVGGGSAASALYGSYELSTRAFGVFFRITGDIVPDRTLPCVRRGRLPVPYKRVFTPTFEDRGLQPFHDFFQGPDWWSADHYKVIEGQLAKQKMNFLGLHTYPYNAVQNTGTNEPTVWLGSKDFVRSDGTIDPKGAYPAAYASTHRGQWGNVPMDTSDYLYGADQLFPAECVGSTVQEEDCPFPDPSNSARVFAKTAVLLKDAFSYGRDHVGMRTAVGVEVPLTPPAQSPGATSQDLLEGAFLHIDRSFPIDVFWLWTPEGWEWGQMKETDPAFLEAVDDLFAAVNAKSLANASFDVATCGWVLGPLPNRAIFDSYLPEDFAFLSSIDMKVGYEPVDPAYKDVTRHKKWAIPWMEDDPRLTAAQLWVNRTLEHMEAAASYGVTGLLGIHWRTAEISPQIAAMGLKAWEPSLTSASFWTQWVSQEFGVRGGDAHKLADLFHSVDSFSMPLPVQWRGGPGGLGPYSSADCAHERANMSFVDKLLPLGKAVEGAWNVARFQYWANLFLYMRELVEVQCAWGTYHEAWADVQSQGSHVAKQNMAREKAVPAFRALINSTEVMMGFLLPTAISPGGLGTVSNVRQHSLSHAVDDNVGPLVELLGELPAGCTPSDSFPAAGRHVLVPTVRSHVLQGEELVLRVQPLAASPATAVSGYYRGMGSNTTFTEVPGKIVNRSVYEVTIASHVDFEFYVAAAWGSARVTAPPGAPANVYTVVVTKP